MSTLLTKVKKENDDVLLSIQLLKTQLPGCISNRYFDL